MRKRCFEACWLWIPTHGRITEKGRWIGLGSIRGRIAYVVFTVPSPEAIRIISLRKASRRESEQYEKAIQDRLEAG